MKFGLLLGERCFNILFSAMVAVGIIAELIKGTGHETLVTVLNYVDMLLLVLTVGRLVFLYYKMKKGASDFTISRGASMVSTLLLAVLFTILSLQPGPLGSRIILIAFAILSISFLIISLFDREKKIF